MTVIQSILLGILQGIAEFLPISSSGHLKVVQSLFGLNDVPLLYDIVLHLATLIAVCIFFRKQIIRLFCVLGRWIFRKPEPEQSDEQDLISGTDSRGRRAIIAILITTFITGIIGIFTSKLIDDGISIKITCAGFIITALLLILSSMLEKYYIKTGTEERDEKQKKGISILQATVVGFFQGFGTFPGISRSGATIVGAQISGVNRSAAGEYSFIVSIPAILGAFVLELKKFLSNEIIAEPIGAVQIIAGCVSAFIFGYLSLTFLMKIIKKGKLEWFACYLIPVGILGMIFLK